MINNKTDELNELYLKNNIDKTRLKANQYTVSLLNEAYRTKLLDYSIISRIQLNLMNLLKDLILRYTNGNSTSVAMDTAESLFCSLLYAIDAFALGCRSHEEAVFKLKTGVTEDIYKQGVEQTAKWFAETKALYLKVRKNKLDITLDSYNLTLNEAIPVFLESYNIIFRAHDGAGSIDYPLVFDDMSIQGVLYIKSYLENFEIETDFCRNFKSDEINKLLQNFGAAMKLNYKIELINVFELVFNNAVLSIMAGQRAGNLSIRADEFHTLNKKLSCLSAEGIRNEVEQAVEQMITRFRLTDHRMLEYIHRYKPLFEERLVFLAQNHALNSIIITNNEENRRKSSVWLEVGERIKDDDFNALVNKLTVIDNMEDKISQIKTGIKSLYDFLDIMNSDCFFGNEYQELFSGLEESELAVLAGLLFHGELRDGSLNLKRIASQNKTAEYEWQEHFLEYLKALDTDKLNEIQKQAEEYDGFE